MRAFTLLEMLLVVALIASLLGLVTAGYRKVTQTAKVTSAAVDQRQRINKAIAEGRIRDQKTLDQELKRAKRITESGLKQ